MRIGCGARGGRRRPSHRRGAGPGIPRYGGHHLVRRVDGSARSPPAPPWWSPRRGPNLRAGRVRRRAAAGHLGAAGPPGSAGSRRHPAALAGAAALVRSRADGGVVAVVAEAAIPTVQALIRWDPVGHAEIELDARKRSGAAAQRAYGGAGRHARPPSTRCWRRPGCPTSADLLGPVELPAGVRRPAGMSRRRAGDQNAGAGAAVSRAWRWRRVCGAASGCSVPGKPTSRSGCRSTRCTSGSGGQSKPQPATHR